jgi:hypothetical protein
MDYFKREELTHGRDKQFPLSDEQEANLKALTVVLNKVREAYGKPMQISSGYRPAAINAAIGGAKKSNHMMCLAADIADKDGNFNEWVMDNLDKLKECGVEAIEDPKFTVGWTHLQIVPVKSGNFVFKP